MSIFGIFNLKGFIKLVGEGKQSTFFFDTVKRIIEWLGEGHRVKVDLFLRGRYKYMEFKFLKGKLEDFLTRIDVPFKVADEIKKSPKGLSCTLERDRKAVSNKPAANESPKDEKEEKPKVEKDENK